MRASKGAAQSTPATTLEWAGARTQRIHYGPVARIFAQGDPATRVMYIERGAVRLSVLSPARVSQETLAEMVGTTRSRVNFFMHKFRKLGFIEYKRGLKIHNSLLSVVLRD